MLMPNFRVRTSSNRKLVRSVAATTLVGAASCGALGQQTPGAGEARDATRQPPGVPKPAQPENPTRTIDYKPPQGPSPTDNSPDPEKPSYLVGAFVIRYAVEHPQFPALDDLMKA
jgi:hypothetical protein